MRDRPWAKHEIKLVTETAKEKIINVFITLKMVARFKYSYNYKKYMTTTGWMDDEMENVRIFELATLVRKVNAASGFPAPKPRKYGTGHRRDDPVKKQNTLRAGTLDKEAELC